MNRWLICIIRWGWNKQENLFFFFWMVRWHDIMPTYSFEIDTSVSEQRRKAFRFNVLSLYYIFTKRFTYSLYLYSTMFVYWYHLLDNESDGDWVVSEKTSQWLISMTTFSLSLFGFSTKSWHKDSRYHTFSVCIFTTMINAIIFYALLCLEPIWWI